MRTALVSVIVAMLALATYEVVNAQQHPLYWTAAVQGNRLQVRSNEDGKVQVQVNSASYPAIYLQLDGTLPVVPASYVGSEVVPSAPGTYQVWVKYRGETQRLTYTVAAP